MSTMGFEYRMEGPQATGRVVIGPYLQAGRRWPGVAALLTFADVLIGQLASAQTYPRISVTADLGVTVFSPLPRDGIYEMTAEILKTGRTMTVGETRFYSTDGRLLATSVGTFVASPRPTDEAPNGFPDTLTARTTTEATAPSLTQQVGIELIEPGRAEITLRPDLFNATESLQGGLVALLGEVAAASAATAHTGHASVVSGLQVHYLAAARVGPFYTSTEVEDTEQASRVRVEVRDPGRDDRLVSLILADTRPEPA